MEVPDLFWLAGKVGSASAVLTAALLPNPHGLQLPQENPHYYRSLYVEYIYFQLSGIRYPSSLAVS